MSESEQKPRKFLGASRVAPTKKPRKDESSEKKEK